MFKRFTAVVSGIILLSLIVPSQLSAASRLSSSLKGLGINVRHATRAYSQSTLPDSVLRVLCARGLEFVSNTIAPLETHLKFASVANKRLYSIPDSMVNVMSVILVNNDIAKQLQPADPRYMEVLSQVERLSQPMNTNSVPRFYCWYGDSLQLWPTPIRVDTFLIRYSVGHTVSLDSTLTISIKPRYEEPLVEYISSLVYQWLGFDDQAVAAYNRFKDKAGVVQQASTMQVMQTK